MDSKGKAYIVWDSYRNGNYDVFMRSWEKGSLGSILPVANTPRFEAHSSVVADKNDRIWVAWNEGAVNWAKDTGPTDDPRWLERGREVFETWFNQIASPGSRIYSTRKIKLAVFEGPHRKAPVQALDQALAEVGILDHDYPQLFAHPASGQIGLLFHRWGQFDKSESLGLKWAFWEHAVIFYEGDRWSRPYKLLESWGRPSMRSHAAYAPDGTLWVVWPTDERYYQPQMGELGDFSQPAGNPVLNVHAGRIRSGKRLSELQLTIWEEPDPVEYEPVHPREAEQVATVRSYRTFVGGREHRIVRGDLHRHTDFSWDSRGGNVDGSFLDYYRYMLDAAAMDFGGITDHNSGGDWEYAWWLIEKSCDMFYIPRAFTTFYGYERSVQWPDGHRNVFHTRRGVPLVSYFTRPDFDYPRPGIAAESQNVMEGDIPLLYETLHRTGGLAIPHTPGSNMGTDWRYNDPGVEPVVEIFQGDRISYEHPGAPRAPRSAGDDILDGGYQETGVVWNAYRKGYRIGTIASSDHWSTHISYALVYTPDATREAIFEAIKKRHTYGATDNIVLDVRMGDHFMGDEFTAPEAPPLKIRVVGTSAVTQLEIIKDEKIIYSASPGKADVQITFQDQEPLQGSSYYYVRAVQDDGEMAWGSPIWVNLRP